MEFVKYQHLERFGTSEVDGIQFGQCYVFPKLDGTNGSLWWSNGSLQAGSRKRHLSLDSDNAGFYDWAVNQEKFTRFFDKYPNFRLYGEWLVPHSLKTYKDTAWRKFYVFDVVHDEDLYIPYDRYVGALEEYGIDYIPYIAKITNGTYEQFVNQLQHNTMLIKDGEGVGEGIVIKNYDFQNKYGRTTWAKVVTSEFKEKHAKTHGGHEVKGKKMIEEDIALKYTTKSLCEKVYAKIDNEEGFSSKRIPQLLNTVYYDVVNEDTWNFVKEHKNPSINFNTLKHFVFNRVKENLPKAF